MLYTNNYQKLNRAVVTLFTVFNQVSVDTGRAAYNMHVYVILAEEHKPILYIFNHHQQVYEASVFQIPVLHKHVQRCLQA
jgi:hypothetical protein